MGINALTSALATPTIPAAAITGGQRQQSDSASASASSTASSTVPRVVFNPRSHFDASAGVFVMEFRSASSGEIERQFPDEQQLRAYQNAKKLEAIRAKGESPSSAAESSLDAGVSADAEPERQAPAVTEPDSAASNGYQPVRLEV